MAQTDKYLMDENAIINLKGIRLVTKRKDKDSYGEEYILDVYYENDDYQVIYRSQEIRDQMYQGLSEALAD